VPATWSTGKEIFAADGLVLVFVRTKRGADRLAERLVKHDIDAVAMHGDLSQGQRERALKRFESGKVSTLVATDVAARGLDLDDITHVINYDPPEDDVPAPASRLSFLTRRPSSAASPTVSGTATASKRKGSRPRPQRCCTRPIAVASRRSRSPADGGASKGALTIAVPRRRVFRHAKTGTTLVVATRRTSHRRPSEDT